MALTVTLTGLMDEVVITSFPRKFFSRIFRHCMGKNNTPYFVNNCLKGTLYFDEELARRFAEAEGHQWRGWRREDKFYHNQGFCLECNLEIKAQVTGGKDMVVAPSVAMTRENPVRSAPFSAQLGESEVLVLLGVIDKGSETYVLEETGGSLDEEGLVLQVETFDELGLRDRLITGVEYEGRPMLRTAREGMGKSTLDPVILSPEGEELDMEDFRVW